MGNNLGILYTGSSNKSHLWIDVKQGWVGQLLCVKDTFSKPE